MDSQPIVVRVDSLSIQYGNRLAVQDVSFSVKAGEIFGLIGPNGAGKTSIVEAVAGLRPQAQISGAIRTCGFDPSIHQKQLKALVSVQLQESAFPSRATVGDICALYENIYDHLGTTTSLLEEFGLSDRRSSLITALSGGLRQRLALVLAQVGSAQLVVLDELTTGLDPEQRRATWKSVRRLATSGSSVLLTSHYMDEVEALCARVGVLIQGRIAFLGTPEQLIAKFGGGTRIIVNISELDERVVERISGSSQFASVDQTESRLTLTPSHSGSVEGALAAIAIEGISQSVIQFRSPTLEDAYVNLIERHELEGAQKGV